MLRSSLFLPTLRHVFTDSIIGKLSLSTIRRSLSTLPSTSSTVTPGTALTRSRLFRQAPRQSVWRRDQAVRIRRKSTQHHPAQQTSKSQGIGERFRELSRKYGWAAVGVYFGLTVLDFPLCFLAVRWVGTERIAEAEHFVVQGFWNLLGVLGLDYRTQKQKEMQTPAADGTATGVEAAEPGQKEGEGPSIWTQLLLAYGVHKSLIFFRVPLTAAVTPKVVKWLRARGWKIGNPKAKQ